MPDLYPLEFDSIRRVMIVGCGRLGSALAEALFLHDVAVVPVSARRRHSSGDLREKLGLLSSYSTIAAAAASSSPDLILITVPDDAITTVAQEICGSGVLSPGMIVAHPSGSHSSAIIDCCRRKGAITASFHPLQTFPRGVGDGRRMKGITFALEGEAPALPPLRELAIRLGADVFEVPAALKTEYHTAAVLACNGLVALMTVAVRLFGLIGSLPGESMKRLRPLIDATLDNIADLGPVGALTGPVARGDATTVARQIAVIEERLPEYLELYHELSRCLVSLARSRSDVNQEGLEEIEQLLSQLRDGAARRHAQDEEG
jgi:predicted short-subunit dehydrogenase-like oxidoreductase (DUF2520 family)